MNSGTSTPMKVVVSGAASPVGYFVFKKLLKKKNFIPFGLVGNRKEYNILKKLGALDNQLKICDIRNKDSLAGKRLSQSATNDYSHFQF